MAAKILPPRPWKIRADYKRRRLVAGIVLSLAGALAIVTSTVQHLAAIRRAQVDQDLLRDPNSRHSVADVRGVETTHLVFHTYDLEVTYDTLTGVRTAPLSFVTWGAIDRGDTADREVHYDVYKPERFALGWAAKAKAARIAGSVGSMLMIDGFLGLVIGLGALLLKRWREAVALEQHGVELHCKVLQIDGNDTRGRVFYHIAAPPKSDDPDSPFPVETKGGFWAQRDSQPRLVDGKVIALVDARGTTLDTNVLALHDDGWPLDQVGNGQTAGG